MFLISGDIFWIFKKKYNACKKCTFSAFHVSKFKSFKESEIQFLIPYIFFKINSDFIISLMKVCNFVSSSLSPSSKDHTYAQGLHKQEDNTHLKMWNIMLETKVS